MKPTQDTYPFFEANQVLTNRHLNQIFDYLDEQERLTRANLIGIGIECGLETTSGIVDGEPFIKIKKGCGVGSAGYLLIEPDDVTLTSYRKYTLPAEIEYPNFMFEQNGKMVQYPLYELFAAGEPNTFGLGRDKGFLDDKAVVLFLELNQQGLRNCSPNNCDDKGDQVTATIRRLLIAKEDLAQILAKAKKLGEGFTATDIESGLLIRMNLPDLHLPRYNVPNTSPVSTNDVLAGFHAVFQKSKLASNTGAALSAAYKAFRPLLAAQFPSDPFAGFKDRFSDLDYVPSSTSVVRFLPYYYDFFDDVIQAYDEFRWKGAGLLCACCPPEGLFPRHLMLGLVSDKSSANPGVYRHDWVSSPAIAGCEERKAEVVQLFSRLAEMVKRFTNNPTPPDFTNKEVARKFIPVRINPSKLASVPLSQKAIPYYYLQTGTPPLFTLWNYEKSKRNRSNQNLGFRSDEYEPEAPYHVTHPLEYDLEPYNFFRIEGHLGKNVKSVMSTLLLQKNTYRLPVEIIALRTGEFDARMPVDLSKEKCRFEDLEAIFDAFRDEFISSLTKTLASFYTRKLGQEVLLTEGFKPAFANSLNLELTVEPSTFGALLETGFMTKKAARTTKTLSAKKANTFNIKDVFIGQSMIIQATASYASVLLDIHTYLKSITLSEFSLSEFKELFDELEELNNLYKKQSASKDEEWNELFTLLEAVRYANQMEAFRSLGEEYRKRLTEVKKKQFLSEFLQKNPGIQHKAGVPVGGTFILVYHDDPTPLRRQAGITSVVGSMKANFNKIGFADESSETITKSFERLMVKNENIEVDPDIRLIVTELSKNMVRPELDFGRGIREKSAERIIAQTVNEFADGTVVADFYLPYICCSDCSPIQYIFPKDPVTVSTRIECTNPDNFARVVVTALGGTPPYKVKFGNEDFVDMKADYQLSAGKYTVAVRDAEGTVSETLQIEIPAQLALGEPNFDCGGEESYVVVVPVTGGTPPYSTTSGEITNGTNFFGSGFKTNTDIEIVVSDSRGCTAKMVVNHSCGSDLAFAMNVACTSPKNRARVDIVPAGGTEPYSFSVDNEEFKPLTGHITLESGAHQIAVSDASGASVTHELVIPAALELSVVEFICDKEKKEYQARVKVNGGTAPYTASTGKQVSDDEFLTNPVAGGESFDFKVFDNKQCTANLLIEHICEEECTLPCEGQSRKCAYRLWLQPPAKGTSYRSYNPLKEVRLRFNGTEFNLPQLMKVSAADLNASFDEVMAKSIAELNNDIEKALTGAFGNEGKNRLVLSYEPNSSDPFALMWIEHFVCETFSIEFEYSYAKPTPSFVLRTLYTNETDATGKQFNGSITTNVEMNGKQTLVPAFDCRERNKCSGSEFVKLCTVNTLKPSFVVEPTGDNIYMFQSTGKDKNVKAWVWDVVNTSANEPYYEGENVQAMVPKATGMVRLTVINENGCFAVVEKEILQ